MLETGKRKELHQFRKGSQMSKVIDNLKLVIGQTGIRDNPVSNMLGISGAFQFLLALGFTAVSFVLNPILIIGAFVFFINSGIFLIASFVYVIYKNQKIV